MKEYKLAREWKFMLVAASIALMIAGVACIILIIENGMKNAFYEIPGSVILFAIGAWLLKITLDYKVVISEKSIRITDNGRTRELQFDEIKGFIATQKSTILLPKDKTGPDIGINMYTDKYAEIQYWISSNFADLHAIKGQEEEAEILQKEEFGRTSDERAAKLANAKLVALIINGLGTGLAIWAWLYPRPYGLWWGLSALYPLLLIAVYRYYNGLIRLLPQKGGTYPGIAYGGVAIGALMVRALIDYDIIDFNNLWLPIAGISVIFTLLLGFRQNEFKLSTGNGRTVLILTLAIGFGYGYGVCVEYNCYMDTSAPTSYHSQVNDMYVTTGRSASYTLVLSPWMAGDTATQDVTVNQDLYNRCSKGKPVTVSVQRGQLNAPWYYVTD